MASRPSLGADSAYEAARRILASTGGYIGQRQDAVELARAYIALRAAGTSCEWCDEHGVCDPANCPDLGRCVECGRPLTTEQAIHSDACPECEVAEADRGPGDAA